MRKDCQHHAPINNRPLLGLNDWSQCFIRQFDTPLGSHVVITNPFQQQTADIRISLIDTRQIKLGLQEYW